MSGGFGSAPRPRRSARSARSARRQVEPSTTKIPCWRALGTCARIPPSRRAPARRLGARGWRRRQPPRPSKGDADDPPIGVCRDHVLRHLDGLDPGLGASCNAHPMPPRYGSDAPEYTPEAPSTLVRRSHGFVPASLAQAKTCTPCVRERGRAWVHCSRACTLEGGNSRGIQRSLARPLRDYEGPLLCRGGSRAHGSSAGADPSALGGGPGRRATASPPSRPAR